MDRNSKDVWTTKPNMLGLFNLVNSMSVLGPPRALWEGGRKGEGLIHDIKPHIHDMRNNWMYHAMKRVAQDISFNVVAECECFRGDSTGRKESETCDSNLFASYASVEQFNNDRHTGMPLSGFVYHINIYVMIRDKYNTRINDAQCFCLVPDGTPVGRVGLTYFAFILTGLAALAKFGFCAINKIHLVKGVILLPLVASSSDERIEFEAFECKYSAKCSDWTVLKHDYELSVPCTTF